MNIKEHIEAGHYPTDGNGRALVPTGESAWEAVIAATDAPGEWVLMGWVRRKGCNDASQASWFANGMAGSRAAITLLPPPPRRVKVQAWALVNDATKELRWLTSSEEAAIHEERLQGYLCVELTGGYDEPWDTKAQTSHPDTK